MSGGGGGGGNPALEEEHPEHENHERYLLTYADMITLLLALFIVLFAIGQTDQAKFNEFRAGLASEFGNHNFDGGTGVLPGGESVETPVSPSDGSSSDIKALLEGGGVGSDGAVGTGDTGVTTTTTTPTGGPASEPVTDPSGYAGYGGHVDADEGSAIAEQISETLTAQGISIPEDARVIVDPERGVVIQLSTDDVTFATGSATLTAEGRGALDSLVPALQAIDNPIEIDGHTDDTGSYDLNWDLSGGRAAAAVKYLQNTHGLVPDRLHYAGYGETKPIAGNDTAEGQRANRRVEVVIVVDPLTTASGAGDTTATPTGSPDAAAATTTPTTGAGSPATPTTTPTTGSSTPTTGATHATTTPTTASGSSSSSTDTGPRATTGVVLQPGSLARQAQN
jgi:chemotaxis protein MotB